MIKKRTNTANADKIRKLRESPKWKLYYSEIVTKAESKINLSDEKMKEYVDKLVLMEVDQKNPMKSFDDFWRNI